MIPKYELFSNLRIFSMPYLSSTHFLQAAHALLQFQDTSKPVYKTKNVSLNALCELYSVPVNPMKDQLKYMCQRDFKFWARRPLSRDMILYAAADVVALVPHIHNVMRKYVFFMYLCECHCLHYDTVLYFHCFYLLKRLPEILLSSRSTYRTRYLFNILISSIHMYISD